MPDSITARRRAPDPFALRLASQHRDLISPPRLPVGSILKRDLLTLRRAYAELSGAAAGGGLVTPAAQWVLDNLHLVATVAADLPPQLNARFLRELPAIESGRPGNTTPVLRIQAVLGDFLRHVDYAVDSDRLADFLHDYQTVTPLRSAELWSIPAILRLLLFQEFTALAELTAHAAGARSLANEVATQLLRQAEVARSTGTQVPPLQLPLAGTARFVAFAAQLIERLQHRADDSRSVLTELAQLLPDHGLTLENAVRIEHQRQSSNNVRACNLVSGLRTVAATDWRLVFEALSLVEQKLLEIPSYAAADRATRDRYRHCVAELAHRCGKDERQVAGILQEITANSVASEALGREIGYHLLDAGRPPLETRLGAAPGRLTRARRMMKRHATGLYLTGIASLTAAGILFTLVEATSPGVTESRAWVLALISVLAFVPASELAVRLLNQAFMLFFPARPLPRLALTEGIPAAGRTLVVVPMMLTSRQAAEHAVRELEVHALANRDSELHFAMLSDWADSAHAMDAVDEALLAYARMLVSELNRRHVQTTAAPRFYLLHRRRVWSDGERCWMGWERKRGKLTELNRLILGARDTTFMLAADDPQLPRGLRFVLTLDADSRLPIGAVQKLVGTALHPLNIAVWNPATRQVERGFGILQPRITPLLAGLGDRSLFQWAMSGSTGVDPYAGAVSDFYQDFMGTGIYTGKGLYDPRVFESALQKRVPENAVLSHDLLEGLFARCGLVSDVEVFEEFPSHSEVAAARAHRWTRGDWQLLPWLVGRYRKDLPLLGVWQLFDNLRRSLLAPATMALFLAAWCLPGVRPAALLSLMLLPFLVPVALVFFTTLFGKSDGLGRRLRLLAALVDLRDEVLRAFLAIALLPQNAWLTLDAATRSLFRLGTRRHLLEWRPAAQVKATTTHALSMFVWPLKGSAIVVVASSGAILWTNPANFWAAAPWLFLWWLAPVVAQMVSLPASGGASRLTPDSVSRLRRIARHTWHFFSTFVTPEDNDLPPDNFQETPQPVRAHRTSPTNIGLYLLACATARDFGWLGINDLTDRLLASCESVMQLPRFRGHLYNWYDTRSLEPLNPRYISTVDSGNLAGHLLAIAQFVEELLAAPALDSRVFDGLQDTGKALLHALDASAAGRARNAAPDPAPDPQVRARMHALCSAVDKLPTDPRAARSSLLRLEAETKLLAELAPTAAADSSETPAEWQTWMTQLAADVASHSRDWQLLLPEIPPLSVKGQQRIDALLGASGVRESLREYPAACARLQEELSQWTAADDPDVALWPALAAGFARAGEAARVIIRQLLRIESMVRELTMGMDFSFLYNRRRNLFSIGYRPDEAQLDDSFYDLLASEARLASLIAIATAQAPVRHWFHLGRPIGGSFARPVLLSWSGSMFEYLMPSLVMRNPAGSLLAVTSVRAVQVQIRHGAAEGIPWGVSESAYNLRDQHLTYQYTGFGVPELGLKRGLSANRVVAPYASALAAMERPREATANLVRLRDIGAAGDFGMYEAVDYTPERLPDSTTPHVVRAYMAHHQAMSLVAIGNVLHDGGMQRRFHKEPLIEAAELLLHEKPPRHVIPATRQPGEPPALTGIRAPSSARHMEGVHAGPPHAHLLSNRRFTSMVSFAGAGYSTVQGLAITRWRQDSTCERYGTFIYIRDTETGSFWSAGRAPCSKVPDSYDVCFDEDKACITRRDAGLTTRLEIVVSPEEDTELRRITVTNSGPDTRTLEVTSYAEIVLAPQSADVAHPAFSNLFIRTDFAPGVNALLATRRPRNATDSFPWAAHVAVDDTADSGAVEYETDRCSFIGRNHDIRAPLAVTSGMPLSNTVGPVLDPVFALRRKLCVPAGGRATIVFATLVADSREEALKRAARPAETGMFDRSSMLAWTYARAGLHHLGIKPAEARLYQGLLSHIIFPDARLRAARETLLQNRLSVRALWRFSISGDRPIVLIRCSQNEHRELAAQLVRAQAYWHSKQTAVDLVLLNEMPHSYADDLQHSLLSLQYEAQNLIFADGNRLTATAFVLRTNELSEAELVLLLTAADVVLEGRSGTLATQLAVRPEALQPHATLEVDDSIPAAGAEVDIPELEFDNSVGGFADGGREYVVALAPGEATPAPWSNVIANPEFGTLVTEAGASFSWCGNSRENQLTPWSNDPVTDGSGEAAYIRDEASGACWSPAAQPIRLPGRRYVARHGQGYSVHELRAHGIMSRQTTWVAHDEPAKFVSIELCNLSSGPRRLSVAFYLEWVLGSSRDRTARFITTSVDRETGALLAQNPWSADFSMRVAFADLCGAAQSLSGDRREVLGYGGSLRAPRFMDTAAPLSGEVGAGLDPCGALRTSITLEPGGSRTVTLIFGQGANEDECRRLVTKYRTTPPELSLRQAMAAWDERLGKVQITTPDRSMDLLFNRWLLYQVVSSRLWGRTGFYQAGGAYGFRDQLQDVMSLLIAAPELARQHILRAAAHQFEAGDVQHWWHPPSGRGVRTHFVDDRLWLPFVVDRYVAATGDDSIWAERRPFLTGPQPAPEQEDLHFEPGIAAETGTIYEHCARAIDVSLATGPHGLPLFGGGDWNDGMNRVGADGRGESVWMAWFLAAVLPGFATRAAARGDMQRSTAWTGAMTQLRVATERAGWDGAWYRRGYFDDGTPLGSAASSECRIDAIAQSWAVLSGTAPPDHARTAMASVDRYLARPNDALLPLLAPPFDGLSPDPGYIRGYLPGLRENGGQYNHAAVWVLMAQAALGKRTAVVEVFDMINPVRRSLTQRKAQGYRVEPYVIAADINTMPPNTGRGGWTWYTGAAGWLYQAILESVLGLRLRAGSLSIAPVIPADWEGFEAVLQFRNCHYTIRVQNAGRAERVVSVQVDGRAITLPLTLLADGKAHEIHVVLE
jgi:cyclic beta-1,2-glucan synthetase